MSHFSGAWVIQTLSSLLQSSPVSTDFKRILTDSRKIQPGDLFVALKGDTMDGHDFIEKALAQGVSGVLCRADWNPGFSNPALWRVKDPLEAYRKLAHAHRMRMTIPVICIAGSVGKTTTKEFLAAILKSKFTSLLKTEGSQNGFIGIPMTLLELRPEHTAAVIEVGIDEPGTMIQHLELVQPTHTILTAIGPEHLEKLIDLTTVAREEALALQWTHRQGGEIVLNLDDPYIAPLEKTLTGKNVSTFRMGTSLHYSEETLHSPTGDVPLPLPGRHNAQNLALALTLAHRFKISNTEAAASLQTNFKGAKGRTEIFQKWGHTFISDHYNSNPTSMNAALELFKNQKIKNGWICLGDMLELGKDELRFHEGLKTPLLNSGASHVFLFGPRMKSLAQVLQQSQPSFEWAHFESKEALATRLAQGLETSTPQLVLIKGSRGMKMEEIHEHLNRQRK